MPSLRQILRQFHLRDDADNSMTVVISQVVSLLVLASLAGLMFVLITGSTRIQAENSAQTEMRVANRAFIADVENAATISVRDDTSLTFSSTKFLKDPASTGYLCRSSTWSLAPASTATKKSLGDPTLLALYEDIAIHSTASCASKTTSTQHRTAISALDQNATFTYANIAGVPLSFSNGIVTNFQTIDTDHNGTLSDSEVSAFRNANHVDSWYTNDEAMREVPKVITLKLTAVLPITGSNSATIKATTNDAETELVGNDTNVIDPGGEQTRWIPNAVTSVLVSRSPSVGTVVGGSREGLQLSWAKRPAAECSPTQTATYSWLVRNLRTGHTSSGQTTSNSVQMTTGTGGNAEVWNGGIYSVSVAVRCNDIDGQSATTTTPKYTLPLPDVTLTGVTANTPETSATVSWNRVSSDPTTKYTVTYAPANTSKTYAKSTIAGTPVWTYSGMSQTSQIAGSPTASLSITKTGNKVVPGYPDVYLVRASTTDSPNTSGPRSPANYTYRSGAAPAPKITALGASSGSWSAVACPTGNTAAYRSDDSNTLGGTNTTALSGTGSSARSRSFSIINQGSRVWLRVDARCSTPYTLAPTNGETTETLSPFGADATSSFIRPIYAGAAPTGVRVDFTGSGNGSQAQTGWNDKSCPTGTTRDFYFSYTNGVGPSYATWMGVTTRTVTHGDAPGSFYQFHVKARCSSEASGTHQEDSTGYSSGSYYTAVPGPSISMSVSARSAVARTRIYAYTNAGCAAQTAVSKTGTQSAVHDVGTYYLYGSAVCVGANGRSSGRASSSVAAAWYQPAPSAPSGVGGVYVMSCTGNGKARDGFTGTVQWNSSAYATSYTGVVYFQNRQGTTSSISLGSTTGSSESITAPSSSTNPNAYAIITAHGPGGTSSSTSSSLTMIQGGCV